MAGIGLLGFLGGASGQALDAMKSRQDDEREDRKLRMLEELRRDTAVFLADYKEKLDQDDVNENASGFDSTTGEYIMRNKEGKELGRRKDPGMAADYQFKRDSQALQLDAARANIDQSRASAEASRASAANSRRLAAGGGSKGSLDNSADRLAVVNKIENNLQAYGFNQDELARARERLLEGVRKGWTLDQFVEFERSYLAHQRGAGRTTQLSNLDLQADIFGKPKRPE